MRPFFESTHLHDATEAIARVIELGGGATAVAVRLGTSGTTISNLRRAKRVQNAVFAHLMEDIASESGDRSITARVLSGMDEWDGATRPTNGRPRRRRSSAPAQNRTGTRGTEREVARLVGRNAA